MLLIQKVVMQTVHILDIEGWCTNKKRSQFSQICILLRDGIKYTHISVFHMAISSMEEAKQIKGNRVCVWVGGQHRCCLC